MTLSEILSRVDHTNLNPAATPDDIRILCQEAMEYKTASVCVNGAYVPLAVQCLGEAIPVCAVVGFPLGAVSTQMKVAEAREVIANGAREVDMVIAIGRLKAGDYDYVLREIQAVKEAVGKNVLKVIIETCLLTQEEKETMCRLVERSGADYIKTSTGFSKGGATFEDIALFSRCLGGRLKIKAAGGIRSIQDMERFIQLGADRLGTSSAIKLVRASQQ